MGGEAKRPERVGAAADELALGPNLRAALGEEGDADDADVAVAALCDA
jgi:hypothetical protein